MRDKSITPQARRLRLSKLAQLSRLANHSAVAILVHEQPEKSILLVQRATRTGDPWSGDMAFPGGRQEPGDQDHVATACRELNEETGLVVQQAPLAKLPTVWTKSHNGFRPMAIHPFIFACSEAPSPAYANTSATRTRHDILQRPASLALSHEVTDAVWVPLSLFTPANRQFFCWRTKFGDLRMPCFYYQHYKVWGLTLRMIENLMKQHFASPEAD